MEINQDGEEVYEPLTPAKRTKLYKFSSFLSEFAKLLLYSFFCYLFTKPYCG